VTEEAVRLARLPRTVLDVGRYEVVFDGTTLGSAFGRTLGSAVELDRVLEYEADASGTSCLAPPRELLGTPVVSPLITASAHRTLPSITAVKWDDEGVEPKQFTVLANGVLVDYASSRETVMELKGASSQHKGPLQSYGCAVASRPDQPVIIRTPHLTIAPSTTPASLDTLCKNVSKGVLVRNGLYFNTDQQLASGSILYGAQLFEIDKGAITRRIDGNGLQFTTRQFWKNLQMLGDANTVQDTVIDLSKGQPWQFHKNSVTAPAGLFKDVNIFSTRVRI